MDQPAGWTLTGGHACHGAPDAGYGVHSIAACTEYARGNRGKFVVNNTNGGRVTTQGYGLYSTTPLRASRFSMPMQQTCEHGSSLCVFFEPHQRSCVLAQTRRRLTARPDHCSSPSRAATA